MDTLTKEQTITVKQVITNLDHIVNARFDEMEHFIHHYGLCSNALGSIDSSEYGNIIEGMFKSWSYFSGDEGYPIIGRFEYIHRSRSRKSQYDLSTENGRLRIDLAKHCIQYIKSYFNIEG